MSGGRFQVKSTCWRLWGCRRTVCRASFYHGASKQPWQGGQCCSGPSTAGQSTRRNPHSSQFSLRGHRRYWKSSSQNEGTRPLAATRPHRSFFAAPSMVATAQWIGGNIVLSRLLRTLPRVLIQFSLHLFAQWRTARIFRGRSPYYPVSPISEKLMTTLRLCFLATHSFVVLP